jgi:conjugal transfer pilus assembly protein TraD
MPSPIATPEPGVNKLASERAVNPLFPLEEAARWLLSASIHVAVGLLIGLAAARLIRRKHLHWTWGALSLGIVILVRPVLGGSALTLGVAAFFCTLRSRRWHREDVDAGADLARIAQRRRGPLDALRPLLGRISSRSEGHGADRWVKDGQLVLGRDEGGRWVSIPFAGRRRGTHALIVGATGSGKTVTQTWMAVRAIEQGMGAIVVDPKGDRAMRGAVRQAAEVASRRFIEWSPDGPSVYNPYARGSETEIADKVLAGERFTEPHYLRQAQRYLGHVVRALHAAELEISLRSVIDHLEPSQLERLVRGLPEGDAQATHAYLDSLTTRQQSDLAGVRDRMAILAESDVGVWLDPATAGCERFDLLQAAQARAIVYFDLAADTRPLLTQMLGAAIVQDLQTTTASLQARPTPTLVVIDEFSALAAEQVVRLFGRASSAGLSLMLSTQELSDLRLPGRERLLEQVMGNLSVLIAHRQVVPDSAELIASLAGTRGAWRTSRHGDGAITRTRTSEGVLTPNEIMGLGKGWAAVIAPADGCVAHIAHILSTTGDC